MVERGRPEVIVHVEHVRQQGLRGVLLHVHLLHLVLDQDRLPRDLRSWPGHPQKPGDPLEKKESCLKNQFVELIRVLIHKLR